MVLGVPFPPGWLQGVDRAGAEGLPGAHPPSLTMGFGGLEWKLYGIFNGDFQWGFSMGIFNGVFQWCFSMGIFNGDFQWGFSMGIFNGMGRLMGM
jgi:hypothetical protein